jgi:opacity protein-like surface antigen
MDEFERLMASLANQYGSSSFDLRIIPLTANIKFEREIAERFGVYFGAGLGMANVDLDVGVGPFSYSDDDWVFVAQAFAGAVYNVTDAFEVYGGARYIYFSDASLSDKGVGGDLEIGDDFLLELGARYNF